MIIKINWSVTLMRQLLVAVIITFISFIADAQIEKIYKIAEDGFEWILCREWDSSHSTFTNFGAEDLNGNVLVPSKFNQVYYSDIDHCLIACLENSEEKRDYSALYTKDGVCISPIERKFTYISKDHSICNGIKKEFFHYVRNHGHSAGICDANGKILFDRTFEKPFLVFSIFRDVCFQISYGDGTYLYLDFNFNELGNDSEIACMKAKELSLRHPLFDSPEKTSISNHGRFQTENAIQPNTATANQQNQGNQVRAYTETVPVQVWQACGGCNGSGQCQVCFGSGWILSYNGNKTSCTACHGTGKCTSCAGHGGQNVVRYEQRTVYR